MINRRIGDIPVRVETTAMLQNPTDFSQTELLCRFALLKIEARMLDHGDIVVDRKWTNELVAFNFISPRMQEYVWSKEIDSLVFVNNFMVR